MTRCLFCGAYCKVECGVYCEGYPEIPGENEKEEKKEEDEDILGCTQIGTSYICDSCLKDLKEALGLC